MDTSPVTTHAIAFVQRFLPPDVSDAHSLLYDWDNQFSFTPTQLALDACLREYTKLLAEASRDHISGVLQFEIVSASELALAYLNRAERKTGASVSDDVRRSLEPVLNGVASDAETFLDGRFRYYDAIKRVVSIKAILDKASET